MQEELNDNLKNCFEFFKRQAMSSPSMEVVGFLGLKDEKPVAKMVKNRSPDPKNYFAVDPLETLNFKSEHDFLAIFHSHIYGDSQFSEWDKITSDNCMLPFLVYSLGEEKFNLYIPEACEVSSVNLERLKDLL